ncbi:condensation domain-containing protein [Embleya sp. NPDC020886]|uniref:condensation domain-containing protein n=1 Tax=Embleya sp. NPDC020886 TaxID=3363980 RepID=UPI003799C49B
MPTTPDATHPPVPTTPDREAPIDAPALVRRIWADILDIPEADIGPDDTFLSLGGDSILAVRTAALVRRRAGAALALSDVRVDHTLAEFAGAVAARAHPSGTSILPDLEVTPRPDPLAAFPLLPLQQGYFVGQQDAWELSYASAHHYLDFALHDVDADEAPEALRDALQRLTGHQPMLRARITADGRQHILDPDDPDAIVAPTVYDWRDANPAEARARVDELRERMRHRGPDPQTGPGIDVRLSLLPGGRARIHSATSLLLIDGWSSGLFYRDLLAFAADWNAVPAPLDVDFGDYATALAALPTTPRWIADRDWWWARLPQLPAPPALPLVVEPDAVAEPVMTGRELRLSPSRWRSLQELCRAHGVTPSSATLAAYTVALARMAGHRRFLVGSLQLGRLPLHPDVHRMIGAFSTTVPLAIELDERTTLAEAARSTGEHLGRALAHNLVSGVEIGRELARRRGTTRPVAPVVFQSTLGVDAAMGSAVPEDAGPLGKVDLGDHHQELRTPQVALEARLYEARDELVIAMSAVEELFDPAELDALFAHFTGLVAALAEPEGWRVEHTLPQPLDPGEDPAAPRLHAHARVVPRAAGGAPRDDLEQAVTHAWRTVLGLPEHEAIDRAADFFAMGGDSLLAVRMLATLARTGVGRVAPRAFLTAPTVAALAEAIRRDAPARA